MKKHNFALILLILIMALTAFTACSSGEESDLPEEMNIGILRVPNDETIAIAEGLFDEYFESQGIAVNLIVFDSGREANAALASGSIDFAAMGNTNAIVALATELDTEMIWIHEVLGEIEALVAHKDSGVQTVEDLAGKTVATPFASTSHYILLNALKEAGVEEDVTLLDMQTTEIVAAWERGDIDAAYVWEPSLNNLKENGTVLVTSQDMAEKGYITANVKIVRTAFSEQYPQVVADYVDLLAQAGEIYRQDPEYAAEVVSEELEIPAEEALMQMQGSIWEPRETLLSEAYFGTSETPGNFASIMKDTSDFLLEQGSISDSPSLEAFEAFVNPKYIELSLE